MQLREIQTNSKQTTTATPTWLIISPDLSIYSLTHLFVRVQSYIVGPTLAGDALVWEGSAAVYQYNGPGGLEVALFNLTTIQSIKSSALSTASATLEVEPADKITMRVNVTGVASTTIRWTGELYSFIPVT
jgi:hypothetical protein